MLVAGCGGSSSSGGGAAANTIVIGSILHDEESLIQEWLWSGELAVQHINDSGVFSRTLELRNLSSLDDGSPSPDVAGENAKTLYDQGAIGLLTTFSSLGTAVKEATADAPYNEIAQCNHASTTPKRSGEDDNFFRLTVDDTFQAKLAAQIIEDKGWAKVGHYHIDEPYGNGLMDAFQSEVANNSNVTLTDFGTHPLEEFTPTGDKKTVLDNIIASDIEVLYLVTLFSQAPPIVKYLTDNGFQGVILGSDAVKSSDMFETAKGLGDWMSSTNIFMGTEPYGLNGKNYSSFKDAYLAEHPDVEIDTFNPTAYDCVMAIALSAVYADVDSPTAKDVQDNFSKFMESGRADTEIEIGVGADEFKKAAEAIADGSQVNYEGASGRLIWDDYGDRPSQPMAVYGPNSDADGYTTQCVYSADLQSKSGDSC
jgi:branched-chain amino acid transport system substrate-binding protein